MFRMVTDAEIPHVRLSEAFPTCVWSEDGTFYVARFGTTETEAERMTRDEFRSYMLARGWNERGVSDALGMIDDVERWQRATRLREDES